MTSAREPDPTPDVDTTVTPAEPADWVKPVELTFEDPCREYCTILQARIADKQQLDAEFELKPGGCRWCFERRTP